MPSKTGPWAQGGGRPWRRIRDAVLERNRRNPPPGIKPGMCNLGVVCNHLAPATCAHHTLGRAITRDDPRYLVAACMKCNQAIGDPMRTPDPPVMPVTRW